MSALKVYLAVEPCDMRKGFNGLTVAAVEHLAQPLACGKRPKIDPLSMVARSARLGPCRLQNHP